MQSASEAASRWVWPWIISPRGDMLWLIGGAAFGYALLGAVVAGIDAVLLWFLWVALIDTPHFFGTYSRTYLDPDFIREHRGLVWGSLAWVTLGPTVLLVSWLLGRAGASFYLLPWRLFISLFLVWAYVHVVRQHFGILALYQRKGGEQAGPRAPFLEKWLVQAGLAAFGLIVVLTNTEARAALGLKAGEDPALWERAVRGGLWAIPSAMALMWLWQLGRAWKAGAALHGPKLMFLAAIVPYYAFLAWHPAVAAAPMLALGMFTTVHHDVQYDAIVWFYHRNRNANGRPTRGWAAVTTRNLAVFLGSGLVMGLAFRFFACSVEVHPGCVPLVQTSGQTWYGEITTRELLGSILIGLAIHHYWIDQFIWRRSRDQRLVTDLRLRGQPA